MAAQVFVNGRLAGSHRGGFAAFCIDCTSFLHEGDNVLAVRVDNSGNANIAPLSGDFTIHGGLYRGVQFLSLEPVSISPMDDGASGVYLKTDVTDATAHVHAAVQLRSASSAAARITVACTLADANGRVVTKALKEQSIDANGTAQASLDFDVERPHLWAGRSDPYCYQATVEVKRGETILDRVVQPLGFRYFHVDPERGLILNGKPYEFRGVNYHEGRTENGFTDSPEMREQDNRLMCDMGCTGVRMAHYQHNAQEYDLCDRSGLVVWTELALVNKLTDTEEFRDNVKQQLRELIKQNFNHPSVLFWSMYNEPWTSKEAGTAQQWQLVSELVELTHTLDSTRLTTGAALHTARGPLNWYMDTTGFNYYYGWYEGSNGDWPRAVAELHAKNPGKSVGISEYGAGASARQHETQVVRPTPASRWHPEQWQCAVHESAWPAIEHEQWMWCKMIWCMFDFEAAWRDEGDTTGMNDKGLVSADRKVLKDAYFFYKAQWTTEPFVYITDRRFVRRPPGEATLKVYSNEDSVELRINGQSLGVKHSNNHVFTWLSDLPEGEIEVTCAGRGETKASKDAVRWTVSAEFRETVRAPFQPK